jgi:hypothetical protein
MIAGGRPAASYLFCFAKKGNPKKATAKPLPYGSPLVRSQNRETKRTRFAQTCFVSDPISATHQRQRQSGVLNPTSKPKTRNPKPETRSGKLCAMNYLNGAPISAAQTHQCYLKKSTVCGSTHNLKPKNTIYLIELNPVTRRLWNSA